MHLRGAHIPGDLLQLSAHFSLRLQILDVPLQATVWPPTVKADVGESSVKAITCSCPHKIYWHSIVTLLHREHQLKGMENQYKHQPN